eukprot:2980636-Pleurochrysis_carterae.AAC.1
MAKSPTHTKHKGMANVDDGVKPTRLGESHHRWDATVDSHWTLDGKNVEEAAKDSSCATAKFCNQITLGDGETLSAAVHVPAPMDELLWALDLRRDALACSIPSKLALVSCVLDGPFFPIAFTLTMAAAVVRPVHAETVLGLLLADPGKVLGALELR